jgi:hypothetical protein
MRVTEFTSLIAEPLLHSPWSGLPTDLNMIIQQVVIGFGLVG